MQAFSNFVKLLGAARLAAIAAVTLIPIGFFSFLMIRTTAPLVPLFTDLSAENSASIVKDLERQAIQYELRNDGAIVMVVPKDKVARLSRGAADLEAVFDVPVQVSAVLGRARMEVGELLGLGPGAVLELDRKAKRSTFTSTIGW